jgi:homogentisate phytyltransferase/homogentisate geranylgeranyltransferase
MTTQRSDALKSDDPLRAALSTAWQFMRPHTIVGTTLAVLVFYVLAATATGKHRLGALLVTYVASLAINVYIVGLNQLTDVEIDRVNKPFLPLASGALSRRAAMIVVSLSGVIAIASAASQGRALFATIVALFAVGTAYSLPPFRLKRFPFWAAASIIFARALVFNIGLYVHFSRVAGGATAVPLHVALFVAFMLGFVAVIALMKDVPDVDGDEQFGISTFVLRMGARRTVMLCRLILTFCYAVMIAAGLAGLSGVNGRWFVTLHVLAVSALWVRGSGVDTRVGDAVYRYYMFVWGLFYFEFVAFAFAALMK